MKAFGWRAAAVTLVAVSTVTCGGWPRPTDQDAAGSAGSTSAAPTTAIALPVALLDWPAAVQRPRLSRDGTAIAFASDAAGSMDLYVAELGSGQITQLTDSPFTDDRPSWSPDGGELAFHSDRAGSFDIWVLTLADGSLRRITEGAATEATTDWSADGAWITFVSNAAGSWDVWVVRPDGTGLRRVTDHEGNEYQPKFSPDGSRIVFYPTWNGWTDIYVAELETGELTEILRSDHEDYRPNWSPDGRWIVMASDRGTGGGLWVVPAGGGAPELLAEADHGMDYPDWSAGGDTIVYVAETRFSHLFAFDRSTGEHRRLTNGRAAFDQYPDVAPEGGGLVYESNRYGNEENVVIRDLATGIERRLSSGRINDSWPRYSADGGRIAYTRAGGDQADADLYVADVGGDSPVRWTHRGNVAFPAFCGSDSVAFAWGPVPYGPEWQLWLKRQGAEARRVGAFRLERSGLDCTHDGDRVLVSLFQPADEVAPRLAWIDQATGAVEPLTEGRVAHMHPRLSPDGRWVVYSAADDDGPAAWLVPAGGGEPSILFTSDVEIGAIDWVDEATMIYSRGERREAARTVEVPDRFRPIR